MINTVAQGVLGRNRSPSVEQVFRSARIWRGRKSINPAKMKHSQVVLTLSHLASSTNVYSGCRKNKDESSNAAIILLEWRGWKLLGSGILKDPCSNFIHHQKWSAEPKALPLLLQNKRTPAARAVASGGQWCPPPRFKIGAPQFHVWSPGCPVAACIQYCFWKMWPPFRFLAPPSGFWPPLLLNLADGPSRSNTEKNKSHNHTHKERKVQV